MQDKIILGLLAIRDLSLYDMRKAMEQSTAFFYNASSGSIHPALKKLEANGLVSVEEVSQGKRIKKVYRRTEAGAAAFTHWIEEPLKLSTIKDEAVLRLFFLGHQTKSVETQLADYILELEQQQKAMEGLMEHFSQQSIPRELKHIAWFQIQTLRFGLDYTHFCKEWMTKTLADYRTEFED